MALKPAISRKGIQSREQTQTHAGTPLSGLHLKELSVLKCFSASLAMLTLAFGTSLARAQEPLEGSWVGRWVPDDATLPVVIHFARDGDGYSGSFESEQLRVAGIPLRKLRYEPPSVRWEVVGDRTAMIFEGELRDGQLRGTFREGKAE